MATSSSKPGALTRAPRRPWQKDEAVRLAAHRFDLLARLETELARPRCAWCGATLAPVAGTTPAPVAGAVQALGVGARWCSVHCARARRVAGLYLG